MSNTVQSAIASWGFDGAQTQLVANRENSVFKISTQSNNFALRLHRPGYRTNQELWSELKWMEAMAAGGIVVPAPIKSMSGKVLHSIDGIQVDVLTWLSGRTMGETILSLQPAGRMSLFHNLGRTMAQLHEVSDNWKLPKKFRRCNWDRKGLLGEKPLWDRFWDNPALSAEDRKIFLQARDKANVELSNMEHQLDYGLIHADLVSDNILIDGNHLQIIDFDDGGFGFRLFELATTLVKFVSQEDYSTLRDSLLEGYKSLRPLDFSALNLFILLRATSYIGWNIARMDEENATLRNDKFIGTARHLAEIYLASDPVA